MIEIVREKFTESDSNKENLLCVCALAVTDYTYYDASTNSVIGNAGPQFWYSGTITGTGGTVQTKGTVLGRLTGNYNLNGDHEVRLFCPKWASDGAPIYYVKVNPNYTPTGWLFMDDTEALKTPRGVYRDYGDRRGFHFFFPYTHIDYKSLCYNHDFTTIGDYDEVLQYFGGTNWETLWNIEYTDSMKMFGADANRLGIPTYWAGKNYNPTPVNLFPETYYDLSSTKNYIHARCEAYWGGAYLKQNLGVCWSSTNTTPEPDGIGCTTMISAADSSPFSFESARIPGEPDTLYYLRFFMILDDGSDTLKMGPIVSMRTKAIGKKPTLQPQRILIKDTSATFSMSAVDEDSTITSHGIRVGASLNTMVSVPIIDTYWSSDRYFSAKLTNLIKNKKYYIQAYATNDEGETVSSSYYANPLTASLNSSGFFTTLSEATAPNVGLSLAQNITTNSASVEGYIHDIGGRTVTEWGFVTSTKTKTPTDTVYEIIENSFSPINDDNELLSYVITSLTPGTKYFMRFYAKNSVGIAYSDTVEINTLPGIKVTTKQLSNITKTSAICGGSITGESEVVTSRGVCWGTLPMPTIANSTKPSGKGTGAFDAALSGLTALTNYYVRAYATTDSGTTYGDEKQFSTLVDVQPDVPKVATLNPQVADTYVISGVTVLDEGTQGITNKGVAVSLIPNPTDLTDVESYKDGNADSPIQIDELEKDTDYYVIAYAENNEGFSFGEPLAVKTIADLAAQPFNVDINLSYVYFTKDVTGKTINKVTSTVVCVEPSIKEYGIKWTTDYIRYIDPELNWMMATSKSTSKTTDIWDMPAGMPIYYFGYAITNAGVESRSLGKQITLAVNGTIVNPNEPPVVPPITTTTGIFNPPANAVIGTQYLFNNKRWVKTTDGWERDYTYTASNNVSTSISLAPVSGQKGIEVAQKAELFEVANTKKMVAADKFVYSDLEQINYYVQLYLTQNTVFTDGESIILKFGDKEITNITATRLIENGEPNEKIMLIALMATEIDGLITRADDASLIENATDPIQIESVNTTNVGLVVPSSSRKVPMESIYGEENKLNRNWTLIRTEEELNSTIEDGFYGVNLTSGEYTPFGNSEFTLQVTQLLDSDWSSQIAVVYSYGKVRMFCRTLSSGVVGDAPMYGWEEVTNDNLSGTNYVMVYGVGTPTENAAELQAAYNAAKNMPRYIGEVSQTTIGNYYKGQTAYIAGTEEYVLMLTDIINAEIDSDALGYSVITQDQAKSTRTTVIVAPGYYTFGITKFTINASGIDVVSLTGNTDVKLDGINVGSDYVYLKGIDSTDFAITDNLGNLKCENCKNENSQFGSGSIISGIFINCVGGENSFGGDGGSLTGTLESCKLTTGSFTTLTGGGRIVNCTNADGSIYSNAIILSPIFGAIPTSSAGLTTGMIWSNGGVLTIVS